jgi:hypothetical protein
LVNVFEEFDLLQHKKKSKIKNKKGQRKIKLCLSGWRNNRGQNTIKKPATGWWSG